MFGFNFSDGNFCTHTLPFKQFNSTDAIRKVSSGPFVSAILHCKGTLIVFATSSLESLTCKIRLHKVYQRQSLDDLACGNIMERRIILVTHTCYDH